MGPVNSVRKQCTTDIAAHTLSLSVCLHCVGVPHRRPEDVRRLGERLAFWETQSVEPYAVDRSCGEGAPRGVPPAWSPWC